MFNARKFRAAVILKGLTLRAVASELGIAEATLYRKMHGRSDFSRKEIQMLCKLLEIDDPSTIFFAEDLA